MVVKIERAWKQATGGGVEGWKEIDEGVAARELANAHGDEAVARLKDRGKLETRFAEYRMVVAEADA